MDVVVLAGGYATRLWPITRYRPKMVLPIGETTVIDRVLSDLETDDRISSVYLSTNARFKDTFEELLADRPYTKPVLSIEQTTAETEKLGVIGALAQLIERESITDDLLVIAGDNYISFSVSAFLDQFNQTGQPTIAAYDVGSTKQAQQYGVIKTKDGNLTNFEEKPDNPDSSLVSIACYGFPNEVVSLFDTYLTDGNNPDEPGWFIQWLYQRQQVAVFTFDEAWFDIGTPQAYLETVAHHLNGDVHVAPSATVKDSDLNENVHVMPGATVTDSSLEQCVVFPETEIRGCDLEQTIVDEQARLHNLTLTGSTIGAHSEVYGER